MKVVFVGIYCMAFLNTRHLLTLDIGIIHLFCLIANFMTPFKNKSQYTISVCVNIQTFVNRLLLFITFTRREMFFSVFLLVQKGYPAV